MELAPESAAWLYAVDSLSNTADEQSISLRCLLRVGTYLGLKVPRLFKHLNICLENSHEIERNCFALSLSLSLYLRFCEQSHARNKRQNCRSNKTIIWQWRIGGMETSTKIKIQISVLFRPCPVDVYVVLFAFAMSRKRHKLSTTLLHRVVDDKRH